MAPEVDTHKHEDTMSKYGLAVDVYSYAMVVYELLTCVLPWEREFPGPFMAPIQQAVREGKRPQLKKDEEEAAELNGAAILVVWMRKCWAHHPKDRPRFRDVLRACRQVETVARTYREENGEGRRRGSSTYASPSLLGMRREYSSSSSLTSGDVSRSVSRSVSRDETSVTGDRNNAAEDLMMRQQAARTTSSDMIGMIVVEEDVEEEEKEEKEDCRTNRISSFDVDMSNVSSV
jgi:hypothetical protein